MDVQFIMIMTIFEWKSGIRLTFDPDVGFWKLKKGKSSEFRWESIFEGKKIQKIQKNSKNPKKSWKKTKNPRKSWKIQKIPKKIQKVQKIQKKNKQIQQIQRAKRSPEGPKESRKALD